MYIIYNAILHRILRKDVIFLAKKSRKPNRSRNAGKHRIPTRFEKYSHTEPYRAIDNAIGAETLFTDTVLMDGIIEEANSLGMPLSVAVADYVKCHGVSFSDQRTTFLLIATSAYGMFNEWCMTQQVYRFDRALIDELRSVDLENITFVRPRLPFECIYLNLNAYNDTPLKVSGLLVRMNHHSDTLEAVLFHDRTASFGIMNGGTYRDFIRKSDPEKRAFLTLACAATEYLLLNPTLAVKHTTRKVRIGATGESSPPSQGRAVPAEWTVSSRVVTEKPVDMVEVSELIPPSRREEVIEVSRKGTHASPREHERKEHYRTYWTGPGRTIPVRKLIKRTTVNKGKSSTSPLPEVIRDVGK